MAENLQHPALVEEDLGQEDALSDRFMGWVRSELVWYAGSFTFHLLALSLLLLLGNVIVRQAVGDGPSFDEAKAVKPDADPPPLEKFEIGETPEDPSTLDTDSLTIEKPAVQAQEEEYNDESEKFEHRGGGMATASKDPSLGGLGGFNVIAYGAGAKVTGKGGVGVGLGTGANAGSGGNGSGFGGRGSGHRKAMLGSGGGTKLSERAVAGALNWLYRHQLYDGSWSFDKYKAKCSDATCTGPGSAPADAGATALGLLPFLAAGQTHKTRGPYRSTIEKGLLWLMRNQDASGNLAKSDKRPIPVWDVPAAMYSHGLATITLCEAYGLSGDRNLGAAAQQAVNFTLAAQGKKDFGWRYNPGDPGDTSVYGWQVMALKSAQMAGLNVGGSTMEGLGKWLDLVKFGPHGSNFAYQPGGAPGPGSLPCTTAIGLLCRQYLHTKREDPMMVDGVKFLMDHMPDAKDHNVYYWYYATQVLHNYTGYEWDKWNRAMRKLLIGSQCRDTGTCANGSWDPEKPNKDAWGVYGGRHMLTALSVLTLEVYYRYLPLYKVDAEGDAPVNFKK